MVSIMKKLFISFSCIFIFLALIPGPAFASWKWTYYLRRATIEGYVFVDKDSEGTANGNSSPHLRDRSGFIEEVLRHFKDEKPLESATFSLGTTGVVSRADKYGYFHLKRWWVSARNQPITLSSHGIKFTFNPNLEDRLSNFLFIRVHRDGQGEVFCLDRNTQDGKVSDRVILIYGLGVEIGPFKPAKDTNSWKDAYDLFRSDPDLSPFDFYLFEYRDDQSLITSSFELACFLRLMRKVYGGKGKNILLAHSAGGLVVRHYTVSKDYLSGTVDRFLMLSTPNWGSPAALIHFDTGDSPEMDDEIHSIANQILPESRFLNCLNNRSENPADCEENFSIDLGLQDHRGLNPKIPCAILAGDVRSKLLKGFETFGNELERLCQNWFGQKGENWIDQRKKGIKEKVLDKIPEGDILISLKNQLIQDVPFCIFAYPHGFMHRPKNRQDKRYLAMKKFILAGVICEPENIRE